MSIIRVICLGFLTGLVTSEDIVAIEGDAYTLHCEREPVRDILSLDEGCATFIYWWLAPTEDGCLENNLPCPGTIGGFCSDKSLFINECWEPCMTVHENFDLEINPVMTEYEGEYTCKRQVSLQQSYTLNVAVKPNNITITTEKNIITENTEENVTCDIYRVKPAPVDVYVTVEGSSTQQYGGNLDKIEEERNAAVLKMVVWITFTKSDNGKRMKCNVLWGEEDSAETYESDIMTLNITFAPSGIALEEKGLIPEETEEYFECSSSSSSNPPSTITWMIDNEDVTDEADQTITQGDNNGHDVHSKLTFTVNRDMNGQQLTCQLIYNNDEQYGHTNPLNISYAHDVNIEEDDLLAEESDELTLTCTGQGGNPPSVHYIWTFIPSYDVTSDFPCVNEHSSTCSIYSLSYADTGRYICTAYNNWGGVEPSDDVDVQVIYTPKSDMKDIASEIKVTEGSNVTLPCIFYSYPELEYIIWFDGKATVNNIDIMSPTSDDKYKSIVTVFNVVSNTTVTCVAVQITNNGIDNMKQTQVGDNAFTFYLMLDAIVEEETSSAAAIVVLVFGLLLVTAAVILILWLVKRKHLSKSDDDNIPENPIYDDIDDISQGTTNTQDKEVNDNIDTDGFQKQYEQLEKTDISHSGTSNTDDVVYNEINPAGFQENQYEQLEKTDISHAVTAADYASLNHDPAANVIDSEHTTPGQEPQVLVEPHYMNVSHKEDGVDKDTMQCCNANEQRHQYQNVNYNR